MAFRRQRDRKPLLYRKRISREQQRNIRIRPPQGHLSGRAYAQARRSDRFRTTACHDPSARIGRTIRHSEAHEGSLPRTMSPWRTRSTERKILPEKESPDRMRINALQPDTDCAADFRNTLVRAGYPRGLDLFHGSLCFRSGIDAHEGNSFAGEPWLRRFEAVR